MGYLEDVIARQKLKVKVYKNSQCNFCLDVNCVLKVKEHKKTFKKYVYCEKCFNKMINE